MTVKSSAVCMVNRYMDMACFAREAQAAGAIVFLALHGGWGEDGFVQKLLQENGVPFTGPQWDAALTAIDKVHAVRD